MKKTNIQESDDMLSEYDFDYSKARKNRFAAIEDNNRTIILDPDVAKFFSSLRRNQIFKDRKKRRSFLAPLFSAGDLRP
ncbi:Uncharacterized protein dnl_55600 [Desulfonema limicola]|uniref:Uncharacterized protein n=1 Tax=Desulfonema limicola TaxID=45656 RepID=A0A975BD46_9BACT|nr:hypothetical protein [Desulfonema limicola]QTA83166.1 Uncharacterized protein dnl_55600 [Desulfonema limicola]